MFEKSGSSRAGGVEQADKELVVNDAMVRVQVVGRRQEALGRPDAAQLVGEGVLQAGAEDRVAIVRADEDKSFLIAVPMPRDIGESFAHAPVIANQPYKFNYFFCH